MRFKLETIIGHLPVCLTVTPEPPLQLVCFLGAAYRSALDAGQSSKRP